MAKRTISVREQAGLLPSPGLATAPVLDLMCSHFVLTLAAQQGSKFNVRRDINGLMALAGRHLMWPEPVLARLRERYRAAIRGQARSHGACNCTLTHPVPVRCEADRRREQACGIRFRLRRGRESWITGFLRRRRHRGSIQRRPPASRSNRRQPPAALHRP